MKRGPGSLLRGKHATLTERALSWIAPRRAIMAQHFRLMERDYEYRQAVLLGMRATGYRAAESSDSKTPWMGTNAAPDVETRKRPALVARSRELGRDDPIGCGLVTTWSTECVGAGLSPQASPRNEDGSLDREKATRIEAVFAELKDGIARADGVDYATHQRMIVERAFEDGDVALSKTKRSPDDPVWFEVIEADRLPQGATKNGPGGQALATGNYVIDGVEKDEHGVPVAIWALGRHPTDVLTTAAKAVRLELGERARMIKAPYGLRPGQTRGVPACHAILQDVKDLDLLILASLKRSQIAACFAAFITSTETLPQIFEATAQKYGYKLDQDIEPGMIFKLNPSEKVEFANPNFPTPELNPFIVTIARRIGAALGCSWQVVLKDFSESTYSSARTDQLISYRVWDVWRSVVLAVLEWERFEVLADARLMGDDRLQDCTDADLRAMYWVPQARKWVDPKKEADALAVALNVLKTTSRTSICRASEGRDYEDVLRERIAEEVLEAALRAEAGLPTETASSAPMQDDNEDDDEQEAKRRRAA